MFVGVARKTPYSNCQATWAEAFRYTYPFLRDLKVSALQGDNFNPNPCSASPALSPQEVKIYPQKLPKGKLKGTI